MKTAQSYGSKSKDKSKGLALGYGNKAASTPSYGNKAAPTPSKAPAPSSYNRVGVSGHRGRKIPTVKSGS